MKNKGYMIVFILFATVIGSVIFFQQDPMKLEKLTMSQSSLLANPTGRTTMEFGSTVCRIEAKEIQPVYVSDNYVVSRVPNAEKSAIVLQVVNRETKKCEEEITSPYFEMVVGSKDKIIWTEGEPSRERYYYDLHVKQYDLVTKEEKTLITVLKHEIVPGFTNLPAIIHQDNMIYWVINERVGGKFHSTLMAYNVETGEEKKLDELETVQQGEWFIGTYFSRIEPIEDTLMIEKETVHPDGTRTRFAEIKEKDGSQKEIKLAADDQFPLYVYGDYRIHTNLGGVGTTSISTGEKLLTTPYKEDSTIVYSHPILRGNHFFVNEGMRAIVAFDVKTGERHEIASGEMVGDMFHSDGQIGFYTYENNELFVHTVE
jgi:hypothetical protein